MRHTPWRRYAAKRDANEGELVRMAEQIGALFMRGPPLDGWVFFRGAWVPVEVKNPQGRNRYTDAQVLFLADCRSRNAPVWTWRSAGDVLASLGATRGA